MTQLRRPGAVHGMRAVPVDPVSDPVQGDEPMEDPFELAALWLPGDDDPVRPQMTLSTIDPDGFPNSRTVLLSEFSRDGFVINTDAESRKVRDIARNPRVSLVLLWPEFTRQLVVQGLAEVEREDRAAKQYAARSPYLKQLAWQNTAEFARLPLEERTRRWADFANHHGHLAEPAGWVGFRIRPHRLMFWVSNADAASRRVEYRRDGDDWLREHLPG